MIAFLSITIAFIIVLAFVLTIDEISKQIYRKGRLRKLNEHFISFENNNWRRYFEIIQWREKNELSPDKIFDHIHTSSNPKVIIPKDTIGKEFLSYLKSIKEIE